jgi:hypothetical protein
VTETRLSPVETVTLALRVLMEAGIVVGLAYWGAHTADTTGGRVALGILAPVIGFGLWGAVDFHQAGRLAEPLRLVQELLISGLAALALYAAGQHALGAALAALSMGYHALVYATGRRLLQQPADAR